MSEYYNPNEQEPGSEKRLLIAFALTFVVLLIFQPIIMKYVKNNAPQPTQVVQPKPAPPPAAEAQVATPAASKPAGSAAPTAPSKKAETEKETVIENDVYRIVFSNRGAQVTSWILKKYTDENGKPLELVHQEAAAQYGYPLSLWVGDEGLRKRLASALYVPSATGTLHPPAEVTFEYSEGDLSVRKSFQFDHSYVLRVSTEVRQNGKPVQALPAWPSGFGDQVTPAMYASERIDYEWAGKIERMQADRKGETVGQGRTVPGPFSWAGPTDQYFAAVFLPDNPTSAVMVQYRNSIDVPKDPQKPDPKDTRKFEVLGAAVGNAEGATTGRMFVGPKNLDVLESVKATPAGGPAPDLRGLVDFGRFGFIGRPLFLALRWTYEHVVANWGWAIVLLTVVINLVLFPLRLSQMKSALKMQKAQPLMKSLKDKYDAKISKLSKADASKKMEMRQQMNQEMMALYKREGINPAGGCLPLLIQFPFLIAFYTMLGNAIELRHARWFWIHDLSGPDPYKILPIAIIVTTIWMQKITPQGGMDPNQQKMMMFMMPVMLGFFAWTYAAGLSLYWLVGTLVSIGFQFALNQTKLGREIREDAERRAKKRAQKG